VVIAVAMGVDDVFEYEVLLEAAALASAAALDPKPLM